jgi:hypothetical protein
MTVRFLHAKPLPADKDAQSRPEAVFQTDGFSAENRDRNICIYLYRYTYNIYNNNIYVNIYIININYY